MNTRNDLQIEGTLDASLSMPKWALSCSNNINLLSSIPMSTSSSNNEVNWHIDCSLTPHSGAFSPSISFADARACIGLSRQMSLTLSVSSIVQGVDLGALFCPSMFGLRLLVRGILHGFFIAASAFLFVASVDFRSG